jgi:hypothetical protein
LERFEKPIEDLMQKLEKFCSFQGKTILSQMKVLSSQESGGLNGKQS